MQTNTETLQKWEKPLEILEMKKDTLHWTLASDAGMLHFLQRFSQNLIAKTHEVEKCLDNIIHDTTMTSVRLDNVFNDFTMLANTQFVENRVYDDEVLIAESAIEPENIEISKEEVLESVKKAVRLGLNVLDTHFEKLEALSDSDSDANSDEISTKATILDPKDCYAVRALPHLIGSAQFYDNDNLGLQWSYIDDDGEVNTDDKNDYGSLSESSEDSENSDNDTDNESSSSENKKNSNINVNSNDSVKSLNENDSNIFDMLHSDSDNNNDLINDFIKTSKKPALSRKEKPNLFSDSPPEDNFIDEDDDFIPKNKILSNNKDIDEKLDSEKKLPVKNPAPKNLFTADDDDEEDNLFPSVPISTNKPIQKLSSNTNLFNDFINSSSDVESEDLFFPKKKINNDAKNVNNLSNTKLKRDKSTDEDTTKLPAVISKNEITKHSQNTLKNTSLLKKGLFIDESDDDELFTPSLKNKSFSSKQESVKPLIKPSKNIFDSDTNDNDDDDDDNDLFANLKKDTSLTHNEKLFDGISKEGESDDNDLFKEHNKSQESETKKKILPGAISIFGGNNALESAVNKRFMINREPEETKQDDMTQVIESPEVQKKGKSVDINSKEKYNNAKKQSLLSCISDDDEDELFSNKKTTIQNKTNATIVKNNENSTVFKNLSENDLSSTDKCKSNGNLSNIKNKIVGSNNIFSDISDDDLFPVIKSENMPDLKNVDILDDHNNKSKTTINVLKDDQSDEKVKNETNTPKDISKINKNNTIKNSKTISLFDDDDDDDNLFTSISVKKTNDDQISNPKLFENEIEKLDKTINLDNDNDLLFKNPLSVKPVQVSSKLSIPNSPPKVKKKPSLKENNLKSKTEISIKKNENDKQDNLSGIFNDSDTDTNDDIFENKSSSSTSITHKSNEKSSIEENLIAPKSNSNIKIHENKTELNHKQGNNIKDLSKKLQNGTEFLGGLLPGGKPNLKPKLDNIQRDEEVSESLLGGDNKLRYSLRPKDRRPPSQYIKSRTTVSLPHKVPSKTQSVESEKKDYDDGIISTKSLKKEIISTDDSDDDIFKSDKKQITKKEIMDKNENTSSDDDIFNIPKVTPKINSLRIEKKILFDESDDDDDIFK